MLWRAAFPICLKLHISPKTYARNRMTTVYNIIRRMPIARALQPCDLSVTSKPVLIYDAFRR